MHNVSLYICFEQSHGIDDNYLIMPTLEVVSTLHFPEIQDKWTKEMSHLKYTSWSGQGALPKDNNGI